MEQASQDNRQLFFSDVPCNVELHAQEASLWHDMQERVDAEADETESAMPVPELAGGLDLFGNDLWMPRTPFAMVGKASGRLPDPPEACSSMVLLICFPIGPHAANLPPSINIPNFP